MNDKEEIKARIKKIYQKADDIENEMVALLEKRMQLIGDAAAYKWRYGLMKQRKKEEENLAAKAAALACRIDLVEYTEGLVKYLNDTGNRYERKIASDLEWKLRHQ